MGNFIFCIDSDGAVMDTMTYKHEDFFGPLAAEVFEVKDPKVFQENWEQINLYTKTRGVNRFVGLVKALDSVGYNNIDDLKEWVDSTESLSNDSLKEKLKVNNSENLRKALKWSELINSSLRDNKHDDEYFEGADHALKLLKEKGTVYVVSSANESAVKDEWTRHNLIQYVDDLYCQNRGKKEDVIAEFIRNGQPSNRILMVGDSPGDLTAATLNGALFYPILVGQEKESWNHLVDSELANILDGTYLKDNQKKLIDKFWSNLE